MKERETSMHPSLFMSLLIGMGVDVLFPVSLFSYQPLGSPFSSRVIIYHLGYLLKRYRLSLTEKERYLH